MNQKVAEGLVKVPVSLLATLVGLAESQVDDVESGIEEGIYDAAENADIDACRKAVDDATVLLDAFNQSNSEASQAVSV